MRSRTFELSVAGRARNRSERSGLSCPRNEAQGTIGAWAICRAGQFGYRARRKMTKGSPSITKNEPTLAWSLCVPGFAANGVAVNFRPLTL